jgi:hypothetical protein
MDDSDHPAHITEFGLSGAHPVPEGRHSGAVRYFDENQTHPKATADAPTHTDFAWNELFANLDPCEKLNADEYQKLGQAIAAILTWCCNCKRLTTVGRRLVGLAWIVNPNLHEGAPSASKLAKKFRVHKEMLSEDVVAARRKWNLRNRASGHAWNYKPGDPD